MEKFLILQVFFSLFSFLRSPPSMYLLPASFLFLYSYPRPNDNTIIFASPFMEIRVKDGRLSITFTRPRFVFISFFFFICLALFYSLHDVFCIFYFLLQVFKYQRSLFKNIGISFLSSNHFTYLSFRSYQTFSH